MYMSDSDLKVVQSLVGSDITKENLRYVDFYISEKLSIFIPSIGFCEYAIKPNHSHPSYSFIILFSDNQKLVTPTISIPSDHYMVTCISPEIPHEEKISDDFNRYIALFIDKDFFNSILSLYTPKSSPNYLWDTFAINKNIMVYINKFMSEYEDKNYGSNNMLLSLSEIITNELIRCTLNLDNKYPDKSLEDNSIQCIIDYINHHFSEKITVKSLCNLVNMSESNFNKLFKKQISSSPIEYLINLRLKKAKKFLRETNYTITDIAIRCGFYSASHFSSCFMKQLGITPSDYKKLFDK